MYVYTYIHACTHAYKYFIATIVRGDTMKRVYTHTHTHWLEHVSTIMTFNSTTRMSCLETHSQYQSVSIHHFPFAFT